MQSGIKIAKHIQIKTYWYLKKTCVGDKFRHHVLEAGTLSLRQIYSVQKIAESNKHIWLKKKGLQTVKFWSPPYSVETLHIPGFIIQYGGTWAYRLYRLTKVINVLCRCTNIMLSLVRMLQIFRSNLYMYYWKCDEPITTTYSLLFGQFHLYTSKLPQSSKQYACDTKKLLAYVFIFTSRKMPLNEVIKTSMIHL